MRFLFRLFVAVLVGAPLAVVGLAFLCFQDRPLVERSAATAPRATLKEQPASPRPGLC